MRKKTKPQKPINIYVDQDDLERWRRASHLSMTSLSEWIRQVCNRRAKYMEKHTVVPMAQPKPKDGEA